MAEPPGADRAGMMRPAAVALESSAQQERALLQSWPPVGKRITSVAPSRKGYHIRLLLFKELAYGSACSAGRRLSPSSPREQPLKGCKNTGPGKASQGRLALQ